MVIVGLYSSVPQAGKSTVASIFEQHGFVKYSFATPVKKVLLTLLEATGTVYPEKYLYGDWKSKVIPELGVTGGFLMSSFASTYMRNMINEDTWLNILLRNVQQKDYPYVVIDDLRFPNEYQLMDYTVKICRPSAVIHHGRTSNSEGQLDNYNFSYTIVNDGSLESLENTVDIIIRNIKGQL